MIIALSSRWILLFSKRFSNMPIIKPSEWGENRNENCVGLSSDYLLYICEFLYIFDQGFAYYRGFQRFATYSWIPLEWSCCNYIFYNIFISGVILSSCLIIGFSFVLYACNFIFNLLTFFNLLFGRTLYL